MTSKNKRTAFSLMELSLVVLIVGLLIAGVSQTSKMVNRAKLRSAQLLTQTSPVKKTKNLMLWYETSLPTSFDEDERIDETAVSTWYDNNPDATTKNNASQSTSDYQPIFYENVFNKGIPALRFDGSNDYMEFDGSYLIDTAYTIFVVGQKRESISSFKGFIGGTETAGRSNLFFGYFSDTTIRLTNYSVTLSYTDSSLAYSSVPIARIHSGTFSSTNGMSYWLNGGNETTASDQTGALKSYDGSAIGRRTTNFLNFDIAELIIFTRSLKDDERRAIEVYLGKKYGITIEKS